MSIVNNTNTFDPNREFFVIDSNNCDRIESRVYGFIITEEGIIEGGGITAEI